MISVATCPAGQRSVTSDAVRSLSLIHILSHELRTPLTLIAGPVEQVLKNDKLPADAREQLVVVERPFENESSAS